MVRRCCRRLIPTFLIVLIADAHNGGDAEKASTSYFPEAAAVSSTYQAAAAAHFAGYRAALESATADTGDPIFVEANQGLFLPIWRPTSMLWVPAWSA